MSLYQCDNSTTASQGGRWEELPHKDSGVARCTSQGSKFVVFAPLRMFMIKYKMIGLQNYSQLVPFNLKARKKLTGEETT